MDGLFRFRCKEGSFIWIQISGKQVESGGQASATRYVGTISDLTIFQGRRKRDTFLNSLLNRLLRPENLKKKLKSITDMIIPAAEVDLARIWILGEADLCKKDCIYYDTDIYRKTCLKNRKCLHLEAGSGAATETGGEYQRIPIGFF